MAIERVTPLDESFLRLESDAAHMHVGWVLRFEGPPPTLDQLCVHLTARLDRVPRFRRRLVRPPLGLGEHAWADDPRFAIAHHVDELGLPPPGDDAALRALAGTLLSTRLSRAAPLWRMTLVTGLPAGGWAIVGLAHHALVDGIAAVQVALLLFDAEPDAPPAATSAWEPPPGPTPARMAVRGAAGTAQRAARLAGVAARAATVPRALAEAGGAVARALGRPAAPSALNRPLSAQRVVGHADLDLDSLRGLARRAGVTLNDVVLAAAAIALSSWSRRAGRPSRRLKAMVPVNVRGEEGGLGTRISFLFVELPPGAGAPLDVLGAVHDRTRRGKDSRQPGVIDAALDVIGGLPAPARELAARLMARPEAFNLVVSNVPGPEVPLYALGRRLRAIYPAVPLAERHGLSVAVLSYAGRLHAGLYADPATVGDVGELATEFVAAFAALVAAAPAPAPEPLVAR